MKTEHDVKPKAAKTHNLVATHSNRYAFPFSSIKKGKWKER